MLRLLGLALAFDPGPSGRVLMACCAAALALRALELRCPRLLAPTILGFGWALHGIPWFGGPGERFLQIAVVAGWISIALAFREPLSGMVAGLVLLTQAHRVDLGRIGWGMALLALGFAALAAGVWLQLSRADDGQASGAPKPKPPGV